MILNAGVPVNLTRNKMIFFVLFAYFVVFVVWRPGTLRARLTPAAFV
jgi:hypothetical protein